VEIVELTVLLRTVVFNLDFAARRRESKYPLMQDKNILKSKKKKQTVEAA
jgi:hypothetical protein